MAEDNFLPASLEKLEIGSQRDTTASNNLRDVNPFSRGSNGAFKKLNPIDETFGKLSFSGEECASTSCSCNTQSLATSSAPRHNRPCDDGWSSCKQILHVRSTVTFKRNLVRKSKLSVVCGPVGKEDKSNNILKEPVLKLTHKSSVLPLREISVRMIPVLKPSLDKKSSRVGLDGTSSDIAAGSKFEAFGHSIISNQDFGSLRSIPSKCSTIVRSQSFSTASFQNMRANSRSKQMFRGERKAEMSTEGNSCVNCVTKKRTASRISHSNGGSSAGQSCSHQARLTATISCDDVTIDELASYFDVFVHIPKKMSHMAEMMYI